MNNQNGMKTQSPKRTATPLVVAEYKALREEIVKRIELEHAVLNLTLVATGALFSVGLQAAVPTSVLLIYPMLALFLAAEWMHHHVRDRQMGAYIAELENEIPELKWEHWRYRAVTESGSLRFVGVFSAAGVFISTQLVGIALAVVKANFTYVEWLLLILDVISVIIATAMLRRAMPVALPSPAFTKPQHNTDTGE